ncbi:family 88 glycosyl hydrolase [Mycena alexandri]|uniref:Family 88 glycosyl hydrolase n=1 Tax=Mycena alexandri TaxID=1745969 RepID=A0AAD6WYK8_9AGAR|nr:family 88 glycosyl hydrolase [Mycena alexandri]
MCPTFTTLLNLITTGLASAKSPTPFDPGFNITSVAAIAKSLPSHSWEYGTASEALLELDSPLLSVFGPRPFPVQTLSPATVPALAYAQSVIVLGTGANGLSNGDGAVGDPASLGVSAVLLGKTNATFATAAQSEIDYIVGSAPRWVNGAISQRTSVAELWADWMYMAPPFIAFFAADSNNASLLETAYVQSSSSAPTPLPPSPVGTSPTNGSWHHIVGPQSADPGLWSTGNGWAAAGMTRVLATILKAPVAANATWRASAVSDLTAWIKEIVDGARTQPTESGLLRNYLNDTSGDGHGFGEISGSSLIASVAYRMVVLAPDVFDAPTYVGWADSIRAVLSGNDTEGNPHVTANGTVTPAVNPLGWGDTAPWTAGSPEGNNFVVLLYAAWRDCVYAGLCSKSNEKRTLRFM